jgi:hypothetical protein
MLRSIIRTYFNETVPTAKSWSDGRKEFIILCGELEMIGQKTMVDYFMVVSGYLPGIIENARKIQQERNALSRIRPRYLQNIPILT